MSEINCKICNKETIDFVPQFELIKCSNCGLIFYKHRLSGVELKVLYDKLYNKEDDYSGYKQQAELLRKGSQPYIGYNKSKVLKPIIKHCKKIIEIGAGVGIVGNYLQKKNIEYQGIELDKEAATLAKDSGINVINASFELLQNYKETDAILAFEVIEHIDDLKLFFNLSRNSITDKGYLGFTVPNFNKFYNLNEGARQKILGQPGPPVHINFFTVQSIEKILSQFGFKPVTLKVRNFPDLNMKKKITYERLWKTLNGKYHGPTIICIAQKN